MKVGVVQTNPLFGEVDKNISSAIDLMKLEKADVYVLPELFATGYSFISQDEVQSLAEESNGPTYQRMADFAYEQKCYIAYGFPEKDINIYNSAALVGPDGLIGIYRKVHLFNQEKLFFTPGNLGFEVFNTPIGKIGLMICFDWIFPESARTLALRGAQIIAHPSNLVLPYCPDAMVTRCLENRVYTITANRIGYEHRGGNEYTFIGTSEIVSPHGDILVRLSKSEVGMKVVEIDCRVADNKAINQWNHLFGDRRPEYYCV
ncbi:MAG: acyltransferase [Bacteroidetes bacterium]|nr:acyltransferase [Bacteroidota bacterium]